MNEPLSEIDVFLPFEGLAVGRIFHKRTGWYAGMFKSAHVKDGVLRVRISPLIRFTSGKVGFYDPRDCGDLIVTPEDLPKGEATQAQPFTFLNPQVVMEPRPEDMIVIQAEDEKTLVLSLRSQDIFAIEKMLNRT